MSDIIYKSQVMHQLIKMVDRVATSNATVLILGESGTGKELIAQSIHDKSNRRSKPFVAINCGALRPELLESELFGHEKGSFTGAITRKIGLAEAANTGTLFLDEIGEMPPNIQAKLLRFIQQGEIVRVGGVVPIKVDLRIISATNKELDTEVCRGNFREDLYYRINTITLNIPALRHRREDIPLLVEHLLKKGKSSGLNRGMTINKDAMDAMVKHEWKGNVRELQNTIERLMVLTSGSEVKLTDLPEQIAFPDQKVLEAEPFAGDITLYELERRHILRTVEFYDYNKSKAAESLGIGIKTLYNKLHEYGEFRTKTGLLK